MRVSDAMASQRLPGYGLKLGFTLPGRGFELPLCRVSIWLRQAIRHRRPFGVRNTLQIAPRLLASRPRCRADAPVFEVVRNPGPH